MAIIDIYHTKRRYATILADPPWKFARNQTEGKGERSFMDRYLPYHSMTTKALCALPVTHIADDDCILWLWSTNAHLPDAIRCIKKWGFHYKSCRTWVKPKQGTGYWMRGQTEQLLLATRGSPTRDKHYQPGAVNQGITTVLIAPAGRHSAKPPESYRDIERTSPEPRLELFARRARPGWDSWGLEAKELDRELERDIRRHL